MSFIDTIKRSLGFEDVESDNNKGNEGPNIVNSVLGLFRPSQDNNMQQNNPQQPRNTPNQRYGVGSSNIPRQSPSYDDYDDYVIVPEQSFYEIVLIRPKTIDDINYVVDQVIEEKNPVILDLSFLERESEPNFRLAGDKVKQMRLRYGAQALLLEHNEDKNLIIVSPKKVKVINKG